MILYTNAQSLAGKVSELSVIASDLRPDVIALTETWCNEDISNAVLSIEGYELLPDLRMDRMDTGGGRGGVNRVCQEWEADFKGRQNNFISTDVQF